MMPIRSLAGFARSQRGAASLVATLAVSVIAFFGLALIGDHVVLLDQRDALKRAVDSAGAAATAELRRHASKTDAEIETMAGEVARRYILLNLSYLSAAHRERVAASLDVVARYDASTRTMRLDVRADLGGLFFTPLMPYLSGVDPNVLAGVTFSSAAELMVKPLEVVLAFDVSLSMLGVLAGGSTLPVADRRIEIVRRSAARLVALLKDSDPPKVAVGLVPWSDHVRLSPAARTFWAHPSQGWARYPASRRYAAAYQCRPPASCVAPSREQTIASVAPLWDGCLDEDRVPLAGTQAVPGDPSGSGFHDVPGAVPFAQRIYPAMYGHAYDCESGGTPWTPPADFYLQHCWAGAGGVGRLDAGSAQPHCAASQVLLPLTVDRVAIDSAIAALAPAAFGPKTWSAIGVAWAHRMLRPAWRDVWGAPVHPVDPAVPEDRDVRKVIVLLTDGEDTYCSAYSRVDPACAFSDNAYSVLDACRIARDDGVEIFVVAAMAPALVSSSRADVLRACSSAADDPDGEYVFLDNSDPVALERAFENIAEQLVQVRRLD